MALVHNSVGSNLLNGCCHEAERAERVGECLKALRHALPGRLHAHLDLLVVEIFTACRILRDLTDISQVYMARVPLVMGYINVILPSLAKTLMDIERHYSDKAKTREQRWRVMCHEMNEEIPGTPLPARFAMYNQYLNLLRMVLGK